MGSLNSKNTTTEKIIESSSGESLKQGSDAEEMSSKRKRVAPKTFQVEESKRKRTSKRDKASVRYKEENKSNHDSDEESDYEVDFIVDDRFVKGKRQFKVRWLNYGPKDDSWVNEGDMSCPKLVTDYEATRKEEEEDEDDDYEVEECVEFKTVRGKREFLIKWKGYPASKNTWEPESNLTCPDLIKKCLDKNKGSKSTAKKVTPKKAAKKKGGGGGRGRPKKSPAAKNGKASDKEDDDEQEEAENKEDEPEEEKGAEAAEEEEEETKEDEPEEDEAKEDADDEDDEKAKDEKPYKPGPKSKKRK